MTANPRPGSRWIVRLRRMRAELQQRRAWKAAMRAADSSDWGRLENRRRFSIFPPHEVLACREDVALQFGEDSAAARRRYLARSRACFGCGRDAARLEWIFYRSADWTWARRCGRAGWLLYCADCENHVCFHRTRMS